MTFTWQLPYQPADSAALDRMRQHFHKPSEMMPYAWFMSGIEYMTWLTENPPESFSAKELSLAIREISSGLKNFPGAYDEVWSNWLKYLLPYALQIMNSEKDDSWNPDLLECTFNAIIYVFPQGITEEYPGFRDDLVYTFGTRLFPEVLSRDDPASERPESASLKNPVFNDFWDYTNSPGMEKPRLYSNFYYPMVFCLKYLNPTEIETWVESLLKIESPQWYLSIMTWYLYKDDEAPVTTLISELQLNAALSHQLTRDHFHKWVAEIRNHQTFEYSGGTFPISDDLKQSIEQTFRDFEKEFFYRLPDVPSKSK